MADRKARNDKKGDNDGAVADGAGGKGSGAAETPKRGDDQGAIGDGAGGYPPPK